MQEVIQIDYIWWQKVEQLEVKGMKTMPILKNRKVGKEFRT